MHQPERVKMSQEGMIKGELEYLLLYIDTHLDHMAKQSPNEDWDHIIDNMFGSLKYPLVIGNDCNSYIRECKSNYTTIKNMYTHRIRWSNENHLDILKQTDDWKGGIDLVIKSHAYEKWKTVYYNDVCTLLRLLRTQIHVWLEFEIKKKKIS